jgi:hypothetical protein
MEGYIYIASAFETVNRSTCGPKGTRVDNDPRFWTSPPTWGICRNDIRAKADQGDFIFFIDRDLRSSAHKLRRSVFPHRSPASASTLLFYRGF